MPIPILLLRLEGPLQSWGERARWDYRDSSPFPTKSAVIGLIACAMGISRASTEIVEMHAALKMGVRADRPGTMMTDYQTVSGIIRTAGGGQRGNKGEVTTIISQRQYIQDGAFLVAVTGEKGLLQRCAAALQHPVWPIFLGRKSCPPTRPVFEGMTEQYESLLEALRIEPVVKRSEGCSLLCEIEDVQGNIMRRDIATASPGRQYLQRRVQLTTVEPQGKGVS
ncbi:MAG: type I-E CRISPR-associated protein Cas5/CasD [Bacillota bacterium]|jgi:CRISPR system Cascade subunit CasD